MVRFQPKFHPWSPTNTTSFMPVGEGIGPGELKLTTDPGSPWFGAQLNGYGKSFDLVLGGRHAEVKKLSLSSHIKKDGTRSPTFIFRTGADSRGLAGILHRIASVIWYIVDHDDAPSELRSVAKIVLGRSEKGEVSFDLIREFREMFYPIVDATIQGWFDEMDRAFVPSRILSGKDELIFVDADFGWVSVPADQFDWCFSFYRISQGTIRLKWIAEPQITLETA